MRIVSKFKDYYDGALAWGQDQEVVYVRHTSEVHRPNEYRATLEERALLDEFKAIPHGRTHIPQWDLVPEYRPSDWNRYSYGGDGVTMISGTIFFCGKEYPFLKLKVKSQIERPGPGEENIWVNSFDKDFDKYITFRTEWRTGKKPAETWSEWFAENSAIDSPKINLHFYSPVVISEGLYGDHYIINPCLKDYGFQKLIDPYTAFQEISMFVGGVLTNNPDPPNTQTDKAKVVSHGFDPKYGFRTPPKETK